MIYFKQTPVFEKLDCMQWEWNVLVVVSQTSVLA